MEPVAEPREAFGLTAVHLGVSPDVVTDEHIRVGRIEARDVVAELLAELEVELFLTALLHRHRELSAHCERLTGDRSPELLVHEDPGPLELEARVDRLAES